MKFRFLFIYFLFKLFLICYCHNNNQDDICFTTGKRPSRPAIALSFCWMFLNDACCDPAIDSQIQTYYEELIYVSDLCASKHTQTHTSLQYLFCLACHPKQFKFTNETTQVIKVCPSIAHDADPAGFDGCGVNLPGARGDLCSGGSPVIPSNYYSEDKEERINLFLNDNTGGKPPYFEDFTIEICDPDDDECMSKCYKMDSGFHIRYSFSLLVVSIVFTFYNLIN